MASTVLPNGIIVPEKFSRDWYADLYHNWQELDNLLAGGGANDGTLTIQKNGTTVGTFSANQATDETINISVPDVNDATLTIQQNGTTVDTFTANSSTDKTVNITVPTKTSDLSNDSGFITGVSWNDVSDKPSFATVATSGSYTDLSDKPTIPTVNDATLTIQQNGTTVDTFTANSSTDKTVNIQCVDLSSNQTVGGNKEFTGTTTAHDLVPSATDTYNFGSPSVQWNNAYIKALNINGAAAGDILTHNASEFVPRSGGAVMTGAALGRTVTDSYLVLGGGTGWSCGGYIQMNGEGLASNGGDIRIVPLAFNVYKEMYLKPDGTWTWSGTACQILSDQRLKQQINEIDDKLLDAWEDVELCQFKYNDAVSEKGDKARLHTGYVVQQIDKACEGHGVDIAQYGLFCHEEYPEETEEVEVEQKDGTKTKEKKVIREASEHYSLRYTEALIVECKYLRRCVERLTARIEELEKGNSKEAEK